MYRGTTPNQIFKLDFLLENVDKLYISYSQNGEVVIEKELADLTITTDEITGFSVISFLMSQDDSLLFIDEDILIQIRIKFVDTTAIASEIIRTHINDILKDGEI